MNSKAYTGTRTLVVLALKSDKIRLLVWIIGVAILTSSLVATFGSILRTDEDIMNMIMAHASNPIMRFFLAPASGVSLGGFVMMRLSTVIAIIIAFFSTLTIMRHTRQNEDTGCEELIGSTVVGRHASLLAAVLVTTGALLLLSLLLVLAFMINGLSVEGSFTAGAALGFTGLAFAGIAAITAQLTDTRQSANGMTGFVMAIAFLVSGVGNMLGEFHVSRMEVTSSWLAWLSPFGWYQQMYAFHQNNWWPLLLFIAFFIITLKIAFILNSRRDVGMGFFPSKKGPASASPRLLSPLGLAWRLQHRLFLIWAITSLFFGAVLGSAISEFSHQMSGLGRAEEIFGDVFSMNETFAMALLSVLGTFIVFYTIQAFMRMIGEEAHGLTEPILATPVSRLQWIMSHILCFSIGTLVILILLGLGGSVSSFVETDIRWYKVLEATLLQTPAIFVLGGFCIMIYGLVPHYSGTIAWGSLIVSLLSGPFLGPALDLPRWVQNISPFTHIPSPMERVTLTPILLLLLMALIMTSIGLVSFCYRSLRT